MVGANGFQFQADCIRNARHYLGLAALAGAVIAVVGWLVAGPLTTVPFGERWTDAVPAVRSGARWDFETRRMTGGDPRPEKKALKEKIHEAVGNHQRGHRTRRGTSRGHLDHLS